MKIIEDRFYLEIGDIVYSTITKKYLKVIGIEYYGLQKHQGTAIFENSAGAANCASYSTYFKSSYHSSSEIELSDGKGYIFSNNQNKL